MSLRGAGFRGSEVRVQPEFRRLVFDWGAVSDTTGKNNIA